MNIDQADTALKQMGYDRGRGEYDHESKTMRYEVKDKHGNTASMDSREIADLIYSNSSDPATQSVKVPKKRKKAAA
jgi:hypothetical protein